MSLLPTPVFTCLWLTPVFKYLDPAGWQHHQAAAEDRQEDRAGGGVAQDPRGPEGHGGSASAPRRQGQRSSEGGEARFFSLPSDSLAQTAPVPPRSGDEKPLSAYKCHWRKKKKKKKKRRESAHLVGVVLQKNSCCEVCVE